MLAALLASSAPGQVTQRVSVDSTGVQANEDSWEPRISDNGRFIVFSTEASNLVPNDSNGAWDVLIRDRQTGQTRLASVDANGVQGDSDSYQPSITPDGRFISFCSVATNLVPGDTNDFQDVFVRGRLSGAVEIASVASNGVQANDHSFGGCITPDGRYVSFYSFATNLVPGDTNDALDVFVHDRLTGSTERVSLGAQAAQGNCHSDNYPGTGSISDDGRFVSFASCADNLVPGDTNQRWDAFVRDRQLGITERVDVASNGAEADGHVDQLVLSADGRFVAFSSHATSLVPNDVNGMPDIFVRDRTAATTERVNLSSTGTQADAASSDPSISADGRFVVFESAATNLAPGDSNAAPDIFLHDRQAGTTTIVSLAFDGRQGAQRSQSPSISRTGRYVTFGTSSPELVPADTNVRRDIFVRDRTGGPAFVELCDAGTGGVIACPCGNPPNATGRGCDNSAGTGGAVLFATGGTFLSSDSLVLHTRNQMPATLSVLSQWTAANSSGAVFGMGVRCAAGHVERLYTQLSSAGGIRVPDFAAGDEQVSVRSAARGDLILAGQSRWYVVYYRDPNVFGGCSVSGQFNATQTGQVWWSP
ncbi:MAG: TolB family protein [Planctomycetota bacterium]